MAPFYGWGSTASRLEPLLGGSLLFTTKFPEIPGTHIIDTGCANFIDFIGLDLKINRAKNWQKLSSSVFCLMDLPIHC